MDSLRRAEEDPTRQQKAAALALIVLIASGIAFVEYAPTQSQYQ